MSIFGPSSKFFQFIPLFWKPERVSGLLAALLEVPVVYLRGASNVPGRYRASEL